MCKGKIVKKKIPPTGRATPVYNTFEYISDPSYHSMSDYSILFKGNLDRSTQKLQLRLTCQEDNEFVKEFDRVASGLPEVEISMAIVLKSKGIEFSMKDKEEMYDQTRICSKIIDPELYSSFDEFIHCRLVDSEKQENFTRVYNDMIALKNCRGDSHSSDSEDSDQERDYTGYDSDTSRADSSFNHTDMCELISKTAALPLDSDATLDLIALCSCSVIYDWGSAVLYIKALMLHISRRHDLRSRQQYAQLCQRMEADPGECLDNISETSFKIASDIAMLWVFFRLCSIAAYRGTLLPLVDPKSFILEAQTARPLFMVSDEEYSAQLSRCKTAFQAAMCFVVCGQGDPDRKQASSETYHTIRQKEKGSKYSATLTEASFQRCILSRKRMTAFSLDTDVWHSGLQDELDRQKYEQGERLVARLEADESYSEQHVREFPLTEPIIALKAACGTGKSFEMLKDIDRFEKSMAVIIISHRKALSAETLKRTGRTKRGEFSLYSDIDGKIDLNVHRNLICEYESLGRLLPFKGKFRVIIDEANSVLYQTQSCAGDTQAAHAVFVNLMRLANRVLIMDAFLDQDRIDVWTQYIGRRLYVIENTFKPNQDHEIWLAKNKNAAKQKLVSLVQQGENVIVPCTMKVDAEEIYHLLCSVIDKGKIQLYTAEHRWQNGQDVNEVWAKARVVIHTSTMDSGHSFELDHFGWAVCFFSNAVDIPVESSLQMKSRSRPAKRFVLSIEQQWVQDKPGLSSVEQIIARIHKNERTTAEASCLQYYGERAYWDVYRMDEQPTCPALVLYATMKMLMHRSAKNFRRLFYEMLREDGVQAENFRLLTESGAEMAKAVKAAKKDAKEHAKVPTPYALSAIYGDTPAVVFERMDDKTKKIYYDHKMVTAYKNRLALHVEGSDLPRAMQNIEAKQELIKTAIAVCRQNGRFDESGLFQTEMKLGLLNDGEYSGMTSFLASNKIACTMTTIVTGAASPFEISTLSATSIRENLHCSLRNSEETEKSAYNIYTIDKDLSDRIKELHATFLSIHNTKCRKNRSNCLSLTEGINLLNDVLTRQFGIKIHMNNRMRPKRGETRDTIYEFHDAFQIHHIYPDLNNEEVISNIARPILIPWTTHEQTRQEDILSYKILNEKKIVYPGKAFEHWPEHAIDCGHKPLTKEDMKIDSDKLLQSNAKNQAKEKQMADTQKQKLKKNKKKRKDRNERSIPLCMEFCGELIITENQRQISMDQMNYLKRNGSQSRDAMDRKQNNDNDTNRLPMGDIQKSAKSINRRQICIDQMDYLNKNETNSIQSSTKRKRMDSVPKSVLRKRQRA